MLSDSKSITLKSLIFILTLFVIYGFARNIRRNSILARLLREQNCQTTYLPSSAKTDVIRNTRAGGITISPGTLRGVFGNKFLPLIAPGDHVVSAGFGTIVGQGTHSSVIESLHGFPEILDIGIYGNDLEPVQVKSLGNFKYLERLDVFDDSVEERTLNAILRCPRLKHFGTNSKNIRFVLNHELQLLPPLVSLGLARTNCNDESVPSINRFDNLVELNLSYTNISGDGIASLHLPKLRRLDLIGVNVGDLSTSKFSLDAIEYINVTNALCNDSIVAPLCSCHSLEWLSIAGTEISFKGMLRIVRCLHLRVLDASTIDGNVEEITDILHLVKTHEIKLPVGMQDVLAKSISQRHLSNWRVIHGDSEATCSLIKLSPAP